jgi:hypothetical protein
VVVLGDFNAEPTDLEIQSLYCFSFAANPAPASRRSHNRDRHDLRVAPPKVPVGGGTYLLRSQTSGET